MKETVYLDENWNFASTKNWYRKVVTEYVNGVFTEVIYHNKNKQKGSLRNKRNHAYAEPVVKYQEIIDKKKFLKCKQGFQKQKNSSKK